MPPSLASLHGASDGSPMRRKPALTTADLAEREATAAVSRYGSSLAERLGTPSADHAFALGRILSELEARDIASEYRVECPLPTGVVEWGAL